MTPPGNDPAEAMFHRVNIAVAILLALGAAAFFAAARPAMAAAFLLGGTISAVNFHLLKRTVSILTQIVAEGEARRPARAGVARFFLRYVLLAVVLYVIFRSSAVSVYGLFAGLFLPVAAILLEAVYQIYAALRREF